MVLDISFNQCLYSIYRTRSRLQNGASFLEYHLIDAKNLSVPTTSLASTSHILRIKALYYILLAPIKVENTGSFIFLVAPIKDFFEKVERNRNFQDSKRWNVIGIFRIQFTFQLKQGFTS